MKKTLMIIVILTWLLISCAPQARPTVPPQEPNNTSYPNPSYPNPSYPNDDSSSPNVPADLTPAQIAATTLLSKTLNLPADKITLISTESVTWPNGCLGVQRIGVMCTQAEVPGYKIILDANGRKYEVHTDESGKSALIAQDSQLAGVAEETVIKQLADNLGLDVGDVSVVSDVAIEFPDSCLGVAMEYVMCAQIVTQGRIIVLEANGVQYEYHASEDGSRVQPATLALTWKREGGIAGFCDSLTVFLSGEIYGNQCKVQDGRMGTFVNLLTESDQKQFNSWIAKFGQVNLDESDPKNVSDRMTNMLVLYGSGSGQPSKSDEAALFKWAQDLYQQLYK